MRVVLIFISLFSVFSLSAQAKGQLSGTVFDFKLNEPLFGATVRFWEQQKVVLQTLMECIPLV